MYTNVYNRFVTSYNSFPDNSAINCNNINYTYTEFAQLVSNIRNVIKSEKVDLIGVVTGDDVYTYASIMAIISVGAAYVPLNSKNPKDRNNEIINDAGLTIILTSKPNTFNVHINLKVIQTNLLTESSINIEYLSFDENSLVYLFYTSGSTGKPKGVPIYHRNLTSFINNVLDEKLYSFSEKDRFIQMFELTFDLSVFSFFVPLSIGACSYVIDEKEVQYMQIIKCLEEKKITVALLVPSVLNFLKPYFDEIKLPYLKYSLFCGEALYENQITGWCKCVPNSIIQNVYGPTEATIFYTIYTWNKYNLENDIKNGIVSIGKPMNDLQICIVDENDLVLPIGQIGELCLTGGQVTDKYYNDEDKTKQSFIEIFVSDTKPLQFYKTGDVCYINKNGNLIYCGRLDSQVKIQGHRVELSEIEFHSKKFPGVTNAVAEIKQNNKGHITILIYLEGFAGEKKIFINYLKSKLPPYMIPEKVNSVDKFPLNLNGKIDKQKLKELV